MEPAPHIIRYSFGLGRTGGDGTTGATGRPSNNDRWCFVVSTIYFGSGTTRKRSFRRTLSARSSALFASHRRPAGSSGQTRFHTNGRPRHLPLAHGLPARACPAGRRRNARSVPVPRRVRTACVVVATRTTATSYRGRGGGVLKTRPPEFGDTRRKRHFAKLVSRL